MHQIPLEPAYTEASPGEISARIEAARAALGKRLVILGHHYQRDEIIAHADFRGDSYLLAKMAGQSPRLNTLSSAAFTSWQRVLTFSHRPTRR